MRYVDEFRSGRLAAKLAEEIRRNSDPDRHYHLMEFCGGHTHAIFRYGIQDLIPENVHFIHGPGCPVCVLPTGRINQILTLLEHEELILCCYGDLMRVPTSNRQSLIKAKAAGADVRMVYSTQDALRIARENPQRQVLFFAIGFETTTPPTAVAIQQAASERIDNFSVFCNHVLTPAALHALLEGSQQGPAEERVMIDGFLGPSHVSTIIGSAPYEPFAEQYQRPIVIAGFEPVDVMQSTLMLIQQLNQNRHRVENQYRRAVTPEGNRVAQQRVAEVFELRDAFEWRGLGTIPNSALQIRPEYASFDSEKRFEMGPPTGEEIKGCECPSILRGAKRPPECRLFGTACTPETPLGACMVSSEGACAAYWSYGRFRREVA